jgi:glycosyltransferase involved in cell wall biosynthesis
LKVFYTNGQSGDEIYDIEFGRKRAWKIDLLQGYVYEFVNSKRFSAFLPPFFRKANSSIIQRVDEFSPKIIIVYGWNYFTHLQIILNYKGKIPIVFRGDSTSLDDASINPFKLFIRYSFLKWVYQKVDFVLSPGSASDSYFKNCGLQSEKLIRAPHAVNNTWFSEMSFEENASFIQLKSQFKILESDFVFLFAGKFIEKKNPLFLIDAFSEIAKDQQNARLMIVGDGELETAIRKRIAQFSEGIANRITVLPFQDQPSMKIIYRLANYFVLPSKGPAETWGLSVNEALASGTPVIVSDKCGCAADIVEDSLNGFVFQSENQSDLVRLLRKGCDKLLWETCSINAKNKLAYFNYESFLKAIDHIFYSFEN